MTRRSLQTSVLARAIALTLAASASSVANAQQAFSPAWFAAKGAVQSTATVTGKLPNGQPVGSPRSPQRQSQASQELFQRSINNLNLAARGIAAQQAAQAAARRAAGNAPSEVPDGLVEGGLRVDENELTRGWINATAPTQSTQNGRVMVNIEQTGDKAILNWETFNVGRNTTVNFDQDANWAVLNRVNDPNARPSQILGQIKADGTVLIANRNGVVFNGASQVNVRNLVAAAATITDTQFHDRGLYNTTKTFTDAAGAVMVEQGARITTHEPQSVTDGGGYVMLLGTDVENAGEITTRRGQTLLAAGDSFIIRKGVGTEGNAISTTRGNEVVGIREEGRLDENGELIPPASGVVNNTGLIVAREGDITLTGHAVRQDGAAVATTTVNTRGTIHLLNSVRDASGSVTLGEGSTTAILIEDGSALSRALGVTDKEAVTTALDSQRDALIKESQEQDRARLITNNGVFDNLSRLSDRRDQSRIEIVSGGNVTFAGESLNVATGGQIAVSAAGRTFVADRARLDTSGAVGVTVAMESNNVLVNVQGNELRDSPQNRDSGDLASKNVWVDRRDLILVPAGTGGYESDRWYLPGGLLEVGGYLSNAGHTIGEWAAQGGTITLGGNEVIAQVGSNMNIAGGTLDVQTGWVQQTWLRSADGKIYSAKDAPAWMTYTGLYTGYHAEHARWGVTHDYFSPLLAPQRRLESGYTVGRDAGRLIISAPTALVEGNIVADVYNGSQQNRQRDALDDGYKQAQTAAARQGRLFVGNYSARGRTDVFESDIQIGDVANITEGLDASAALAPNRTGTLWLDAGHLNEQKLGGIDLATSDSISITSGLVLADGGSLMLTAPNVDIDANVTARSGSIEASNIFAPDTYNIQTALTHDGASAVNVGEGVTLDLRGIWSNLDDDAEGSGRLPFIHGGDVKLRATGNVSLDTGSLIDVASGAAHLGNGKMKGGKGGNIHVEANAHVPANGLESGRLTLDGALRGYGVEGGGTLSVGGTPVLIASDASALDAGQMLLTPDFFSKGFAHYEIKGRVDGTGTVNDRGDSVTVADGTVLDIGMPVYRYAPAAHSVPSGDEGAALEVWTPPQYWTDAESGMVAQRKGASLSLVDVRGVSIGRGSLIEVDPGQSISMSANGQVTIDGRLNAWGGTIAINNGLFVPGRSIWIGDHAVLDVAARAIPGIDIGGSSFAHVPDGGAIKIGIGDLEPEDAGFARSISHSFVIVRPGAVLDASATNAGTLAGAAGSITIASSAGLLLDGELRAAAAPGGAGGSLTLVLETGEHLETDIDEVKRPRVFTFTQTREPAQLPDGLQPGEHDAALGYAQARFSAEQVEAGGFDSLSILRSDILRFQGDVSLALDRSLTLRSRVIAVAETTADARISLSAPVVQLGGPVRGEVSSFGIIRPILRNSSTGNWRPASSNAGQLTVNADLIDIGGWLRFGASDLYDVAFVPGSSVTTITAPIEAPGFADVHFNSRGDIRLRTGSVATAGDMTLTATQIYPVTGAAASILAGARPEGASGLKPDPDSVLALRSNGQVAALPSSVFGQLGLIAGTIEQDGILRAPLGTLVLGGRVGDPGYYAFQAGDHVILREGSITSVSAAGLVVPYGGTVDGLKYFYNGRELSLPDLMDLDAMGKIEIVSDRFEAESGSLLDLSGGGELAGAGFVAGRGGSVDILRTPLANANPAFGFSSAKNQVYAILPGYGSGYAPVVQEQGASEPMIGQQIVIRDGIPGLAAGTYTLLPSTYALMPGAYRVEIGASLASEVGTTVLGNGSYVAGAYLGIANTTIRASAPNQIVVTPGAAVRTHSQYNESSYSRFALESAALFGRTRARLPIDGKQLTLSFEEAGDVLNFNGTARFGGESGSYAGVMLVRSLQPLEIKAAGAEATADMTTIDAEDLSSFNAGTLFVGAEYRQSGSLISLDRSYSNELVAVRSGAVLEASQILLAGDHVLVEEGAVLDTTRSTLIVPDSTLGYVFANSQSEAESTIGSMLVVANGWLNLLPATPLKDGEASLLTIEDGAVLRTGGTIGFVASDQLSLGLAQLNARYLGLSLPAVNVGTEASLAAADAAGVLGTGWNFTQTTLDRLLNPATTNLAALERLSLSVRDSINFYGDVSLDARNQGGGSAQTMVVLNTPAIYGWGEGTSAKLSADTLIWNGVVTGDGRVENPYKSLEPPAVQAGGAGTGSARLTFEAREIHLGYDPLAPTQNSAELERLALGFSSVDLVASDRITANNRGRVSFYHSGTDASSYRGGDLNISTPLLTADSGAMIDIRAGGAITIGARGETAIPPANGGLGGEIRLQGEAITLDTTVALPSGRLTMKAEQDIALDDRALIDLAGRTVSFYEVKKDSWGGSLAMESRYGHIVQSAASIIDVSADDNDAGAIEALAGNGSVSFAGTLRGEAGTGHTTGSFSLLAGSIADFESLNLKLNESEFFEERSFTARTGDLVVGDEVKARVIDISADGGSLTVNGRIDASGAKVGTIRLSARDDLRLAADSVLDTHGTVLQTDSHGAAIEASNRGFIELTSRSGTVTLAEDATLDMRSADGVARGRIEINAVRVGGDDIAIDAANAVEILGAASIAVNGFRSYTPVDGIVDQAYLDTVHADSTAFIDAAHADTGLQSRLNGLMAYGPAFHLRPGVELTSADDLVTRGDLDLSGHRYGPDADPNVRGSGESGVLVMRAGGNIDIKGSINDGFAPPPPTNDDYNWEDGRAGQMWTVAPMLAPGSHSWSMRFVSGADLTASDTRAVESLATLGESGNLVLADKHIAGDWMLEAISVVRTGTGYLDLIAGGDYRHESHFGVYTAGTVRPGGPSYTDILLPEGGGDVRVHAGGDMRGYSVFSDLDTTQKRVNEWLRRQEDGAWGINFGSYVPDSWGLNQLIGFSGIGTLGGGNVHVTAGGDAGVSEPQLPVIDPNAGLFIFRSSALSLAIGGGGYVDADGVLRQTGGGELVMNVGGRLNSAPLYYPNNSGGGMLVNVRGDVSVSAATLGLISETSYGRPIGYDDPRPIDPTRAYDSRPDSGLALVLGDSRAAIKTRGDLVLQHANDPGMVDLAGDTGALPTIGSTAFSLWTQRTAVDLFSAGGSVAPVSSNGWGSGSLAQYYAQTYPTALSAVAAGGDVLVFGRAALMESPEARLDLLARDSIYYGQRYMDDMAGNYLTLSGAGSVDQTLRTSRPTRIYAVNGDITNARTGQTLLDGNGAIAGYIGGGPVWMRAGRDIIAAGGMDDLGTDWRNEAGVGGLIIHSSDTDLSIMQAGRDIIYSNVQVAGPGVLALTAGRNIYQGDRGSIVSIGPVAEGDTRPGASILMQAGAGPSGPDYTSLLAYLDPANLAAVGIPLADQPGKVVKTYEKELAAWLKERFDVVAESDAQARAYFAGLPSEQRDIFLREVYFAELKAGGREYNDVDGPRFGSYLRGRQAIAALFPDLDAQGNKIDRTGDIILFGGSGVRTNFGGDIEMLAPGGQIVLGVQGEVPPASAGVMTQGKGDISLFSEDSLLLGLSRIMTTFGGSILGWSEEGDINAGRGAKTTVLFTPPRRTYDQWGNVKLAPQAPSTGAGIATLNPIPEVPPGDVDLIAPLGTIDAGEAGIRVSGNVNLAALHVVNADNIQVQGKATGLPMVAAVNVSALTNASAATAQATAAAQDVAQRERAAARQNLPSIFSVRVLNFGNEVSDSGGTDAQASPISWRQPSMQRSYDTTSPAQIIGLGNNIDPKHWARLTEDERRRLQQER